MSALPPATMSCEKCGRRVVDGSTDFGMGLTLRPTCSGIRVEVGAHPKVVLGVVSVDDLRHFLHTAYGDPEAK